MQTLFSALDGPRPFSGVLHDRRYALTLIATFIFFGAQVWLLVRLIMLACGRVLELGSYSSPLLAGAFAASVALLLVTLVALLINAAFLSVRALRIGQRSRYQEVFAAWSERWVAVLLDKADLPPRPLPVEGLDALLDLKESLTGELRDACDVLIEHYGVEESLYAQLATPLITAQLQALEGFAKLRSAHAVPHLLPLLKADDAELRLMSARAVARTIAALPTVEQQRSGVTLFAEALRDASLPLGALREMLLLLDGRLKDVVALLLRDTSPPPVTKAALDCVGLLQLEEFTPDVLRFTQSSEPEVRAAALKALASLPNLPPEAGRLVQEACGDQRDFVRVQATRAAARLPLREALRVLPSRLADASWWVRRAAAEAMADQGESGREILRVSARNHPDPYARDIARQVLRRTSGTHTFGRGA